MARSESTAEPWEEVLAFWFREGPDEPVSAVSRSDLWWKGGEAIDGLIRRRFAPLHTRAAARELASWRDEARSRLALIIVLDQFSRNLFRGSAETYDHDDRAVAIATGGLALGHDRALRPIERLFFYMPFEHAEDRGLQKRAVELFEQLLEEAPDGRTQEFEYYLDFARRHRRVVDRFGRFPHRNELLGRTSTPEEIAFLASSDAPF